MSSPMQFRNVDYQIEKLKSQKLIIEDEEQAKNLLSISGYSNLIKSYRQPYVYMDNDKLNYSNKKKRKPQFTLTAIIEKLNQTMKTDRDPIRLCREKHGDVPPWILFRGIYFSTMVNFIDQFKNSEKDALAQKLLDNTSL